MNAAALQKAMPGLSASRARELVGPCNAAMLKGNITTRRRAAYFLAQVGHESVSLTYKAEIGGSHTRYAPYYGRTFIQVTWESNYRSFGHWLGKGDYFVKHPAALEQDKYAWLGAVWYWTTQRPCNALCDKGDFVGLTRAINGGTNGLADRRQRLTRIEKLGDSILPAKPDPWKGLTKAERHMVSRRFYHAKLRAKARKSSPAYVKNLYWSRYWRAKIRTQMSALQRDARAKGKGGWNRDERALRFQLLGAAWSGDETP